MSIGQTYDTHALEAGLVFVYGSFAPNGTSAIDATSIRGKGFSVERVGVGMYLLTFDKYPGFRAFTASLQLAAAADNFIQVGPYTSAVSKVVNTYTNATEKVNKSSHGLLDGMKVRLSATEGAPVVCTFTNATEKVNKSSHGLLDGDRVRFRNVGGALPTGLSDEKIYWVVNKGTNDFEVSLTVGGAAVTISDDGTGTNYYYPQAALPTGLSEGPYYVVNKGTNDFEVSLTAGGAAVTFSSDGVGTLTYYVEPGTLLLYSWTSALADIAANANNRINFCAVFDSLT